MTRTALAFALLASASASSAAAQEPIVDNDFAIDLFVGPVLAGSRILGMGGAYTALATGVDGIPWNAASTASRSLWETEWFEWEVTGSIFFPGAFTNDDFDNDGVVSGGTTGFVYGAIGAGMHFGDLGIGFLSQIHTYDVVTDEGGANVSFGLHGFSLAHSFFDHQLALGVGLRAASLEIASPVSGETLVSFSGEGPEIGALWRPNHARYRIGAALRTAVASRAEPGGNVETRADGVQVSSGLVLPSEVRLPWEAQVGLAVQFGRAPLNRVWGNPNDVEADAEAKVERGRERRARAQVRLEMEAERGPMGVRTTDEDVDVARAEGRVPRDPDFVAAEAERRRLEDRGIERAADRAAEAQARALARLDRSYVLVSADVLLSGATSGAVGVEAFLDQDKRESGERPSLTLRAGAETEALPGRVKARAGLYLEPSRFGTGPRMHITGGGDVRLFTWNLFGLMDDFDLRASLTFDLAPRYFDWGIGLGIWH